ncbi:unnamed protein product [Aspergillus oryzae]|uniref:Unnamed protein product n=1 Tax=Aspergillus oryzae TaxID=5062 RepID=A0AAN4YYC8_ASPOZ|nr:unnamed protein product [Aspergillus oryzae]
MGLWHLHDTAQRFPFLVWFILASRTHPDILSNWRIYVYWILSRTGIMMPENYSHPYEHGNAICAHDMGHSEIYGEKGPSDSRASSTDQPMP